MNMRFSRSCEASGTEQSGETAAELAELAFLVILYEYIAKIAFIFFSLLTALCFCGKICAHERQPEAKEKHISNYTK